MMSKKHLKLSDQIRRAVRGCEFSLCALSRAAEIDKGAMSRFMHGKGGLGIDALDRLADLLRLELKTGTRPGKAVKHGKRRQ